MNSIKILARRGASCLALGVLALVPWGRARAQGITINACYKAPSGVWYLIKLPGLPNHCHLGDHAFQFSTGSLTLVKSGFGLTGGPITTTGTLALDTTATNGLYAQLNAANAFNGNQTIDGTLTAIAKFSPLAPPNSFNLTANGSGDAVQLTSGVGSGQALHIRCTSPGTDCYGIWAEGTSYGGILSGSQFGLVATGTTAGSFSGDVNIVGTLTKSAGAFRIDHPLDPANKYLTHSFVESPDMMNIYNGTVVLDGKGEAWVTLPDWFEALNRDFRYQLTAIGKSAPNLFVAEEISKNRFKIEGGKPGGKVSWQVTGVRHDAYAEAHRLTVEEDKPIDDRGFYLHPKEQNQPAEKSLFLKHDPRKNHSVTAPQAPNK